MKDVKILIGIDVETDVGSFTPFYEGVQTGVPLLLELFENLDVKCTFYFTGDSAKQNQNIVQMVAKSNNEIGCHSLEHETVGDELFPIPGVKPLLPHEIEPRIKLATEIIEELSGIRPVSFRCPRLWGSTQVVNVLEKLNYTSDASYPMYFYRKQFVPYYPSKTNWLKKGDSTVLQIPNFADMAMQSNDKPLERDRDQWPLFRTKGAKHFLNKIYSFCEFIKDEPVKVICLYIHPWEFIKNKRKFNFGEATVIPDSFIVKNTGKRAVLELTKIIQELKSQGAEFVTAKELSKNWSKNG